MNQQFHVVMQKGKVVVRTPLPSGEKYLSKEFIHPDHEARQFLEPLGEFAMISVDDLAHAQEILHDGFLRKDGSRWHVGGGYVRDEGVVLCMLPQQVSDASFWERLGLNIHLDKWSDSFKVGKYIKRLWSHHREYFQGDVIAEQGDTITVRLDSGHVITVRYAPNSELTDGMHLISSRYLKMLQHDSPVGAGLRLTTLSPRGFTKGHAIALDHLHYDLVLFDNKTMLKSNGRFTVGLDDLHPGHLFTDPQSVMNFQLYKQPFLEQWAEKFMYQVIDALQDEEKLRQMLRFYDIDFHKHAKDDPIHGYEKGKYIEKEKDWALLRALRAGLKTTEVPALIRKEFHLFVDKIMDCEDSIRIPVQPETGGARYMLVDPTIFDMWGDPVLDGVLRGDEVYVPKHVGQVVYHRQPNAHRGEHVISTSVQPQELVQMDTGSFMFISRDVIAKSLKTLGGGDQDDRAVYYTDPNVVEHFKQLAPYPVQQVVAPVQPVTKGGRFDHLLPRPKPVYDRTQLGIMLNQQQQQRVSIGQAVNPIMVDAIITDQKEVIVSFLVNKRVELVKQQLPTTQVDQAIIAMNDFQGNMLKDVASQLEIIIDAVKRDGADVSSVAKQIRDFWTWLPVVPEFCTHGGDFDGRLPNSRRGEHLPQVVFTELDAVLDSIKDTRVELEDFVTELSWQIVQDVPLEILTYPELPGDLQLALSIRTYYHQQREHLMSPLSAEKTEDRINAFIQVDQNVYNMFKSHPRIVEAMLKLYAMTYSKRRASAPLDDKGRPKAFPDGLLWGPRMGGLTIQALDRAELTNRYVDAHIYPEMRRYKRATHDVRVESGVIEVIGANVQVGLVDPIADGITQLEHGLVRVPTGAVIPQEEYHTDVFTVVAGLEERGASPEDIQKWRAHLCEEVYLQPTTWFNPATQEDEHAVKVLLSDGSEYGNITRRDAVRIHVPKIGWLTPGKSPKTMTVTIKEKR